MTKEQTMQAIRAERTGGPEVLQLVKLPVPQPGPGQLRIRVEAAAVNFSDVMRRRGSDYPFPTEFPYVPGSEVAGVVDALGDGVEGPPVGTRVLAVVGRGGDSGYAQYTVADASNAIPIPDGVDANAAAGLLVAGSSAVLILEEAAALQKGETLFVPAAAGGLGSYAVQIAKAMGARVIAGASTARKRERAADLGAYATIDYTKADWPDALGAVAPGGVDVLLEMAGGGQLERGLRCLAPFGRAVVYGAASDAPRTLSPAVVSHFFGDPAPNQSLIAFNVGLYFGMRPERAGRAIGRLLQLVGEGTVRVFVDHVLPLSQAAEAHRLLEGRKTTGKIVLRPEA